MSEDEVWGTMQRHGIVAHPAYHLGYGRLSCRNCIFGDPDQWATNRHLYPESVNTVADYETKFNTTIHRTENVHQRADRGTPYQAAVDRPDLARLADSKEWDGSPVIVDPAAWVRPAGADNKSKAGPT
jgi:3'-phosphoadenosine 5'-phosphosulfate sulfotransferase (PAPS reductase)/FAD synthetase